jgi:hypothetical protein
MADALRCRKFHLIEASSVPLCTAAWRQRATRIASIVSCFGYFIRISILDTVTRSSAKIELEGFDPALPPILDPI